ncbi:DNA-directed RNA polymerase core subunit rpc10, partial [Coemansia erecta]
MNGQSASLGQAPAASRHRPMTYDCGKCGKPNDIKPKEPVRCLECGYRILYKQRTKKMVQFEA